MPDDVEQPIDYCGIVVMDDDAADDVEVTDAMIEAGYTTACNYPAVALHASHNETRSMVETVYRAMHAARTPSTVSVEEVEAALIERLVGAMPIAETSGWTTKQVATAVAGNILAHPVIIAALSTRP